MTEVFVFLARLYLALVWVVLGVLLTAGALGVGLWSTILNVLRRF